MNRRLPVLLAAVVGLGLVAGCSGPLPGMPSGPGPSTSTSADASLAETSADWLITAAHGEPYLQTEFDGTSYDDYGLTADVVLALMSVGDSSDATIFATVLTMSDVVTTYVGDGETAQYVGATAKLLATTSAAGVDASVSSGRDLASELEARLQPTGRFTDLGVDDYSHTISQAWAVLALAGQDRAPATAVDFLTAQQCPGAGFPAQLSDTTPAETCVPDVDSTAFAISALVAAGTSPDAPALVDSAAWLTSVGTADGAGTFWSAAESTEPSVNSTAVVATALVDLGADASGATSWLADRLRTQGTDPGAFDLAGQPDVRSTAQATVALAGTGLVALVG